MLYKKVTKRCSATKLSREQARDSLERYFDNSEIVSLQRRGSEWVATLMVPHVAADNPFSDDSADSDGPPVPDSKPKGDSDSDDSGDSDSPSSDGPPKAKDGDDKGPESPKGELAEVVTILHAIADKLGLGPGDPMGGDPMAGPMDGPPGPPPGPPGAPPAGPPGDQKQHVVHERALKPGEAAPGTTPIGAPAFASVNSAKLARMQSFDAFDDTPGKSIRQAKEELEQQFGPLGFQVRQIKRVENGQRLAAKLSRR
jgi:hypothetical protein